MLSNLEEIKKTDTIVIGGSGFSSDYKDFPLVVAPRTRTRSFTKATRASLLQEGFRSPAIP